MDAPPAATTTNLFAPSLARVEFALQDASRRLTPLVEADRVDLELAAVLTSTITAIHEVAGLVMQLDLTIRAAAG